jgi:UDP:flavonoid glycosyltransferase YjiC (YdhE family)
MSEPPMTVLFMPESAYGPTNNCVGIGKVLRQRGHRVVFSAEASWMGKLAARGCAYRPPPRFRDLWSACNAV